MVTSDCEMYLVIKYFCKSPQTHACNVTRHSFDNILNSTLCAFLCQGRLELARCRVAIGKNHLFINVKAIKSTAAGRNKKQTDRLKSHGEKSVFVNNGVSGRTNGTLKLSEENFSFSQQIPSLCTWHRDEGPRFQQSGGSLFLPHVHRRASLFCLNLGRPPSGGWSRWR